MFIRSTRVIKHLKRKDKIDLKYSPFIMLLLLQGRSYWGRGRGQGGHAPPTSIFVPERSNSFSFKHQKYCFLRALRNYMDHKFHDFHRVCYNFWTIYSDFSFFSKYTGEIDHFSLDLLKSFSLQTI